jgi:hypothetical protein
VNVSKKIATRRDHFMKKYGTRIALSGFRTVQHYESSSTGCRTHVGNGVVSGRRADRRMTRSKRAARWAGGEARRACALEALRAASAGLATA